MVFYSRTWWVLCCTLNRKLHIFASKLYIHALRRDRSPALWYELVIVSNNPALRSSLFNENILYLMKRHLIFMISVVVLVFGEAVPVAAQPQSDQTREEPIPGFLYIQYERGASPASVPLPELLDVRSVRQAFPSIEVVMAKRQLPQSVMDLRRVHRVQYSGSISPQEAAGMVSNTPGVVYAEPWWPRYPAGLPREAVFREPSKHDGMPVEPNDPRFENEAYMESLRMTEAWDQVKGEDGDVVIAIIDSGTDWLHEDLLDNVWTNLNEIPDNGVDDDENGFIDDVHGWNFENDSPDPTGTEGWHGTVVAGVASAVANNGKGLAGTSWNARFMPTDVSCRRSGAFCFTAEAMLYAAVNGADIINASYSSNKYSRTHVFAIRAAFDLGALVVAAASSEYLGIDNRFRHYPSAMLETLSVCGTQKWVDVNAYDYGYSIDVCTAGKGVLGTEPENGYSTGNGTSFAAPLVSGIAALVRTVFPDFSPAQVREQLRATAVNIDGSNLASLAGLLGRGRVDAYRAVTDRNAVSARLTDWTIKDASGDGHIAVGELVTVDATIKNYLADVNGYRIDWIPNIHHIDVESGGSVTTGPMASGDEVVVQFSFRALKSVPYRSMTFIEPRIRPVLPSGTGEIVSGADAVRLVVADSELRTHRTDAMEFDVTSEGNFGWVDTSRLYDKDYPGAIGNGFIFDASGNSYLHEGGLVIGVAREQISGSVLNRPDVRFPIQNRHLVPNGPMKSYTSSEGHQYSGIALTDAASPDPLGLSILQEVFTDADTRFKNVALVRYTLENPTAASINGIHIGLYFDWDLRDEGDNNVGIDPVGGFSYMTSSDRSQFAGLKVFNSDVPSHSRFYNSDERESIELLGDLWEGMSGGVIVPDQKSDDWAQIVSAGPYNLAAGADTTIEFAILGGKSLSDLRNAVDRVDELLDRMNSMAIIASIPIQNLPGTLNLQGNYPNPFMDHTTVAFTLPEPSVVTMEMYDILGRHVFTLGPHPQGGGSNTLRVERGGLAAGTYVYRIHAHTPANTSVMTGKLIIAH